MGSLEGRILDRDLLCYAIKRTLQLPFLFIGITVVAFLILHLSPTDPVVAYYGMEAVQKMSQEDLENIRSGFSLDEPLYNQYFNWLNRVLHGDLGYSRIRHQPVYDVIFERFPATLLLSIAAYSMSIIMGVLVGIVSASKENTRFDRLSLGFAYLLYSIPTFLMALLAMLIFVVWLGWLPAGRMTSITLESSSWSYLLADRIKHLILPAFVLGLGHMAVYATYLRSSLLESLEQDYIIMARAKGLSERTIVTKHAFRNALLPFITQLGMSLPWLIGGNVVIETIFAWPGIGQLAYDAARRADYTLLMGLVLFTGTLVILGNLLADVVCAIADPRVKYD